MMVLTSCWYEMAFTDRIEVNPDIMLGKPVIRGTRIPVELIVRKLREGASEADLLDAYPRLTHEDIQASAMRKRVCSRSRRGSLGTATIGI